MNNIDISELSRVDLIQINGGVDETAFKTGYAAGVIVGTSIKNFLTLTGIYRIFSMFL